VRDRPSIRSPQCSMTDVVALNVLGVPAAGEVLRPPVTLARPVGDVALPSHRSTWPPAKRCVRRGRPGDGRSRRRGPQPQPGPVFRTRLDPAIAVTGVETIDARLHGGAESVHHTSDDRHGWESVPRGLAGRVTTPRPAIRSPRPRAAADAGLNIEAQQGQEALSQRDPERLRPGPPGARHRRQHRRLRAQRSRR
jgi:hypothetical protein